MSSQPTAERQIYLVRHGETEWSVSGRHTGRTDIPLTDVGREQAKDLGRRISDHPFALVLTSPLSRAAETAAWRASRMPNRSTTCANGTTARSRAGRPWTSARRFPTGRSGRDRGGRARPRARSGREPIACIARCLDPAVDGDALLFAHGHLLRVLAARWLGLAARQGALFALGTATIGILGWERSNRVIETWNEACHLDEDG